MQATIKGIVLSCQEKQAGTKYACYDVKIYDIETRNEYVFQSPVAVADKDMSIPLSIVLDGLDFREINFKQKKTGLPDKFFKVSVHSISGAKV